MVHLLVSLISALPSALLFGFSAFIIARTLRHKKILSGVPRPWAIFIAFYALLSAVVIGGFADAALLVSYGFYAILAATAICFVLFIKSGKEKVVIVESIVRVASLFKPKK